MASGLVARLIQEVGLLADTKVDRTQEGSYGFPFFFLVKKQEEAKEKIKAS